MGGFYAILGPYATDRDAAASNEEATVVAADDLPDEFRRWLEQPDHSAGSESG